jgi:hypothetical protein
MPSLADVADGGNLTAVIFFYRVQRIPTATGLLGMLARPSTGLADERETLSTT